jgi:hypothetical protein
MTHRKNFCAASLLLLVSMLLLWAPAAHAESPLNESHLRGINSLFRQNGIREGFVAFDEYGRVELEGEYSDEKEVDRAFSLAQSVVGIRWVSPVTPENIKVKEWERRLGSLFSRAKVLKPTAREGEAPGPVRNRYALVVGIGEFKYGINPLQYSVRDATTFFYFLTDPHRGNFPRQNVIFLTNRSATRANIVEAFRKITQMAGPDDLVAVYMSSHGTPPDKFGGVHVVTYDTQVKPRERVWHTAITEAMFRDFVEALRARRLIMILDTCYSNGAYSRVPGFLPPGGKSLGSDDDEDGYGISREHGERLLGAKDIVVEDEKPHARPKSADFSGESGYGKVLIGASGSGQKSWESDTLHNSIFTYYFLDGLDKYHGAVEDAFYYARPLVSRRVKEEKGSDIEQTPNAIATTRNWNMELTNGR